MLPVLPPGASTHDVSGDNRRKPSTECRVEPDRLLNMMTLYLYVRDVVNIVSVKLWPVA